LSVVRKTCKNFTVLITICEVIGKRQKLRWHSMTTAGDAVQKIFMNKRVNVNSRECLSQDNNGHANMQVDTPDAC